MANYLKQALALVKAQAQVRVMDVDEMLDMVKKLAQGIEKLHENYELLKSSETCTQLDSKSAIKERSITCLECMKSFRVLTKKHLQKHEISLDEYREKHGYKKNQPLVCKSLQRNRRKKMNEMKLWEKRHNTTE